MSQPVTEKPKTPNMTRLTFAASQLESDDAKQLFDGLGVLHISKALPLATLATIRDELSAILDDVEARLGYRNPYISPFLLGGHEGPANSQAYQALKQVADTLLSGVFPYRPVLLALAGCNDVSRVMFYGREAGGGGRSADVPYHQDYTSFLSISGVEKELSIKRMITCWIPLDDIDEETPTIEYVPARLNMELPTDQFGMLDVALVQEQLDRLTKWIPPVRLGDMCIHDQYTLHRSYLTPERTKRRRSLEMRFLMI